MVKARKQNRKGKENIYVINKDEIETINKMINKYP